MDVISWVVGLVAGVRMGSRRVAMAIGVATSVAIRCYQYFIAETWGTPFPQDLIGAAVAGIGGTLVMAWAGSVVRLQLHRRRLRDAVG